MSTTLARELRAHAESVFAREQADLVLHGRPDTSGEPVRVRRQMIAEDHQAAEFRLVPAAVLRRAADAVDAAADTHRELMQLLVEFRRAVPIEQWPQRLRDADTILRSVGWTPEPPASGEQPC